MNPGPLDKASPVEKCVLGALRVDSGNFYRYVQVVDQDGEEGTVYTPAGKWIVTADRHGGSSKGTKCVGVGVGKIPKGYYGWILVSGPGVVKSDGSIKAGDFLMVNRMDQWGDTISPTKKEQVFGVATTNSASNKVKALVSCL